MTIWDKIYKDFQQGGEAWASLSQDIHPLFIQFINESHFEHKHVLDIGCGDGRYLKFLQLSNFKTDGIDSSVTSVKMTKKSLKKDAVVVCSDMFKWNIPKNKYDLIISISTIHHGKKFQVKNLINKIHNTLVNNGKIFITLPYLKSSKKWNTFKNHKEISKGTFVPLSGPEQGLAHSFYTQEEIKKIFSKFKNLQLDLDSHGRWIIRASK